MHCAGCGHENRAGRRFCAGCGAALELPCARCGFANLPGERFCGGCGAALDAAAPVGERRQVAILFADLAGYTRLSTALDPEEVHRLLTGFFEVVDGACARFGATIDKHIGDNVMAIFGAPVAHGDDPERAVRAAVAIHAAVAAYSARVGRDLLVHVGIAYGEVIASGLGSSHHQEYTVTGDAVNLAARLQDKAVGGETLVSDPVYRAAARIAVAEPVGDVAVKGLTAPVAVWRITDVRAATGILNLIGRDRELETIAARLAAPEGALIIVRGDPGIGKSTLIAEAARRAADAGFEVHAAHVLDFGAGRGDGAIATLVAGLLGASGDHAERRAAIDAAIAAGRIGADDAQHVAGLLELELDDTTDVDQRERRERQHAVLAALIASAPRRPLAVIEDVHWADPSTLARLRHAAGALAARGGALLATTRIDGDPFDAGWHAAAGAPLDLDLEPLGAADAARIATAHLADAELVTRCVDRAAGNPLFLEQLVHAAARDAALPGTLQGVVLARVDRLAPRDRTALQAAAIAGQRFTLDLVRHLAADPGWTPDEVIARRLLRVTDDDLAFHHALILDGIYASITHGRRRDLHRTAAAYFAGQDLDLHAEHLERASDPRAAAAWLAAAERHVALHSVDRALEQLRRGLTAATSAADRHGLHAATGRLHLELGDIASAAAAWAEALAAAPDEIARCRALIGVAGVERLRHAHVPGHRALDEAHALAVAHGLVREQAEIAYLRGCFAFFHGSSDAGAASHRLALDLARQAGDAELAIRALSGIGDSHYTDARFDEAHAAFAECVRLCQERGMRRYALPNRAMMGDTFLFLGDWPSADRVLTEVVAEAAALGVARTHALALESLVFERSMAWRDVELRAILPAAHEAARAGGFAMFEASCRFLEAELEARGGVRASVKANLESLATTLQRLDDGFVSSLIANAKVIAAETRDERMAAIAEGEARLAGRAPLARLMFYRSSIEAFLFDREWDLVTLMVERLAPIASGALLAFTVDRARFLCAWHQDDHGPERVAELRELHARCDRAGYGPCLPPLPT